MTIARQQFCAAAGVLLGVALAAVCFQRGSASFQQLWEQASCYTTVIRPAAQYRWTWAALLLCVTALGCAIWFPRASSKPPPQTLVKGGLLALAALATAFVALSLAWIHTDHRTAVKPSESYCYQQR